MSQNIKNVFAKMLYDDKKIEMVNYDIYNRWFDEFVKKYPLILNYQHFYLIIFILILN